MTNPDNIVRVRARNGGRASVYEANGWGQAYSSGLLEGNGVVQNTVADMNVLVGGSTTKPDVVLAENPAGYRIALDLVGQQPIAITAPATNSRISAIVAYTDDLSLESTEDTVTGSPASCGLIVVNGTAGSEPSEPTDSQIRTAITADGATGSQAAYAIIATIEVASDTTIITDSLININQAAIPSSKLDWTTFDIQSGTVPSGNNNISLSEGKWIFFAYCTVLVTYGSEKSLELSKNGSIIRSGYFGNNLDSTWGEMFIFDILDVVSSDTYVLKASSSSNPNTRSRWMAIRIS